MTTHEYDIRWSGRHAVVTMPAEIDLTTSSDVNDLLAAVAAQSPEVVTVDLAATAFCDSAGVNSFIRAQHLTAAQGAELRIALGGSPVARILQLIGIDQVIPVYQDVQKSLNTPKARKPVLAAADDDPGREPDGEA